MNERAKAAIIRPDATVKEAIAQLDKSGERILLPVDGRGVLLGTVTDGDIRRYLLRSGDLNLPVGRICNPKCITVEEAHSLAQVRALMLKHSIEQIPVIDARRHVVDLLLWNQVFDGAVPRAKGTIDVPVVIMAGGRGSRMDPVTRILPKPLVPVEDRPILQVIMDRFAEHGATRFLVTVNYKAKMIRAYFDGDEVGTRYKIEFLQEQEATGTAGSLALLPKSIRGDFFLSNCDILVDVDYADILKHHREQKNDITVVASLQHLRVPYGVVEMNRAGVLQRIVEKPEYDLLANTGLYVLAERARRRFPKKTAFDMTELLSRTRQLGGQVGVFPVSQGAWIDVGQWADYLRNAPRMTLGSGGAK